MKHSEGTIGRKSNLLVALLVLCISTHTALSQATSWNQVEIVFGKKGAIQGDVFKVSFPRGDLHVTVGDVVVAPGLALTSWLAFKKEEHQSMMMGDLVLLDGEVPAVQKKLVALGIDITALHNHLIDESPAVKYMHIEAVGEAQQLSQEMKSVLELSGTPMASPSASAQTSTPDWSKVEAILGRKGNRNGNVLSVGIPRSERILEQGMEIPPFMGTATGINIQMIGDKAATTGDFVLLADEVNPVIKVLNDNGIAVTALHNHMLREQPRLFMLHFWGHNAPEKLAEGLKAALEKTASQK